MKESIAINKSYDFAIRIMKLFQYLNNEKKEFVLSNQILRSGTSIGANIEEAQGGQSEKDFISKLTIAYKETRETHYWLRLMRDTKIIEDKLANSLISDCEELLKIIPLSGTILKTMKNKKNS